MLEMIADQISLEKAEKLREEGRAEIIMSGKMLEQDKYFTDLFIQKVAKNCGADLVGIPENRSECYVFYKKRDEALGEISLELPIHTPKLNAFKKTPIESYQEQIPA